MANVIKHKRGSGSDPVASDLVVGEVAIRTDVGKLFTKMDNGTVAEIAGGGSDIAINTLSSSSGTGGGSATFNGSAFRFTLSAPPSVSAQQLLVSINGVIQKPVAGTGQPSEGFSIDGTDIILGAAPATGSDFFILTFKSLGVSEPADNSVTSAKIADGAIVNADINASAAIAGTKVSPDFGSQNIVTTGTFSSGDITIADNNPTLTFSEGDANPDYRIIGNGGKLTFQDVTNSFAPRLVINTDGHIDITGNLDVGAGIDVTGAITGTGDLTIDTNTLHVDSSNNRVGIGTTSPANELVIDKSGSAANCKLEISQSDGGGGTSEILFSDTVSGRGRIFYDHGSNPEGLKFEAAGTQTLIVTTAGNVGIGTTSPSRKLHVASSFIRVDDGFGLDSSGSTERVTLDNGFISLRVASAERMRIDSSGRLLLGTTSARGLGKLEIEGTSFENSGLTLVRNVNSTGATSLNICKSRGGIGSVTSVANNDVLGGINFRGADGANLRDACDIRGEVDGTPSQGTDMPGRLVFRTSADGSSSPTERMRIDSLGNVGIGTTTPTGSNAGYNGALLHLHQTNSSLAGSQVHLTTGVSGQGIADGSIIAQWSDNNLYINNQENAAIRFFTNNGDRGRIDADGLKLTGKLFIGSSTATASTNTKLKVHCPISTSSSTAIEISQNTNGADKAAAGLGVAIANGGESTNAADLTFQTANGGSLGTRMTISAGGNIGAPSGTNIHNASDERLKKNVVDIDKGLSAINLLRPVSFNWIDGFCDEEKETLYGFIAQEVQAVDTNLIQNFSQELTVKDNTINDVLRVNEKFIIPMLVKAVQELTARLEALEAK